MLHFRDVERKFTPTRSRSHFHHPSLAAEVLDVARAALERDGASGLSLRAVAKSAGVYPTAISHHYGDREGLLAAVATRGFVELNRALEEARAPNAARSVRGMLKAYLSFAAAHPRLFVVMFSPWSAVERRHPQLDAAGGQAFSLLRDQVASWVFAEQAQVAVDIAADTLWCTVHGLATLLIEEHAGKRKRRFDADAILELALRSLSPAPGG